MKEVDVRGYICSQATFLTRRAFLENKSNESVSVTGHGPAVLESLERVGEKYGYRAEKTNLPDNDFCIVFTKKG